MRNRIVSLLGILSLFLAGCQEAFVDVSNEPLGDVITSVLFTLEQYEGDAEQTRTTYDYANKRFLWAEGDAVGIVNGEGGHLKFLIREDYYGSTKASFDGRGYALLSGVSYGGYSPFYPDYDLDPTRLPISYIGQAQSGSDDQTHLGDYSFIAAIGTAPETGSLSFKFKNIGSPHRYNLPVLPGDYQKFKLVIDRDDYVLKGTVNLLSPDETSLISISPLETSNEMSLDLSGTSVSDPGVLSCWLMMPPANLSDIPIRMVLTKTDGSSLVACVPGRDCPANNRRFFYAQSSVYPSSQNIAAAGQELSISVVKASSEVEVVAESKVDWLTTSGSSTNGLVTVFNFSASENSGAERMGTINFTETSTGLVNTVVVVQQKAGTVIGIGGWSSENHSGRAN